MRPQHLVVSPAVRTPQHTHARTPATHATPAPHGRAPQMGLHVFFGCYFNLFRLMAKCGVLQNLLLKEHTHTFCNNDGDVRELDFRFFLNGTKIGAPFHGECDT
jgi:uncharacterized protein with NAD-binding domain and iron-sulfur cluster